MTNKDLFLLYHFLKTRVTANVMLLPYMVVFSYLSKNAMENQPLEMTI